MKRIIIRMNIWILALLLAFPLPSPAEKITWFHDGVKKKLTLTDINLKDYLSVDQLARMAESQLHWQSVTQQVCLSKVNKSLCLNWERQTAYLDDYPEKKKYDFKLVKRQLYVPFKFVTSKTFKKFSGAEIKWNSRNEQLVQNSPVNLTIPAVENLGDRYKLELDIDKKAPYRLLEKSDKRIWVRFVRGRTAGSSILEGDDVIKEVRINQKKRSADLILKMGKKAKGNDVYYDPKTKNLVFEVFTTGAAVARPKVRRPAKSVATKPRKKYKPVDDKTIRTIVIDPGHGGKDSGALGTRGTREKDINLKAAKALASRLRKEKNTRVILTRKSDVFVPLGERTRIANEAKADLFVSIHCNASLSAKNKGFEVYVMALEATDKAAEAVARAENSVVELETKKKGSNSDKLTQLLASMAVNNFFNESSECSSHICRGVKKKSPVKHTAVKQANFHVLRGAQMPAVLVELGYLSNPISELKLRSSRYRSLLVKGIHKGIMEFDHAQRKQGLAMVEANK